MFQVHRDVVHMERTKHCDDARESEPHCGSLVKPCFTHSEHRCKTRASRCKSQQFCNVGKTYLDGSPDVQCTLQRSTGLEEQNVLNEPVVVGAAACNPLAIAHSTRGILLPGLNDESISSMQILTSPREEESGYEDNLRILKDYFQMSVDTDSLYKQWNMVDSYFKSAAKDLRGVRILRQDPVENLFSFICSSNNNISRISSMVENLCSHYGRPVAHVDGKLYCSFPSVGALAQEGVEDHLRQLGFGYRAKYVSHCAQFIMEHHEPNWFQYLRDLPYSDARSQLMKLCGVGPKVLVFPYILSSFNIHCVDVCGISVYPVLVCFCNSCLISYITVFTATLFLYYFCCLQWTQHGNYFMVLFLNKMAPSVKFR